ncbi:MAG: HAMP domain-containing protein [Candidatus Omnitrophica bacterium]|nr:HAMP domain-containing protein [Candidatus Omnitrophota bacterium]
MFNKLKLGPKYFLSLVVISIIPLLIISLFIFFTSQARIEKNTIDSLHAINNSRAKHINHLIQLRQEQAKLLSGTYIARQLNPEGLNRPETGVALQKHIESVYNELKARPRSEYEYIDLQSAIENISVWDILGNIVADTNKRLVGKKMPFKFLQILYDKGAYFKGFEIDALTGEKFLTVLEGVRNWQDEKYAGVVFLKTKAKVLNDITTDRQGLGKTAETYLVDRKKKMITESRFLKDAVLRVRVDTEATKACFKGGEVTRIYKNYQGKDVLGVQKYLPDQQWCLVTEMDAREAFAPVNVFRNRILFIFGGLMAFILVLVHFSGQTFIRPILDLRDASLKVASGNYGVEISMQSSDEIGELSRAFSQMAKVLASTTRQLEEKNKILEKQKEELKRFDELKSEFVSMVSHELRTPMAIIKGSISQLLDETEDAKEDTRELLDISLRNVNRLSNLINNLLDLSKIEAGKVELRREPTDIVQVVKEVCHGFEPQARQKGLAVKSRFNKEKIVINVDKDKIIQVMLNLIGNSMKFVETGHVEVAVEEQDSQIVCHIIDTGKGISRNDLEKVFDKFKQFGRKTGPGTKGTGLGLSISKGLVELHGGRVWVDSELNKGTTFSFSLPKAVIENPAEEKDPNG